MKILVNQKSKGFTLVELLLFIAISSFLIVLLLAIIISFFKSRTTAKKLSLLQDAAVYIFNELTQEVHWSEDAPTIGTELTLLQTRPDEEDLQEEPDTIEVNFKRENDQLVKTTVINGVTESQFPLSPPKVKVIGFTVDNVATGEIPCLEIHLELEYDQETQTRILSDHKTTISLRKQKLEFLEEE